MTIADLEEQIAMMKANLTGNYEFSPDNVYQEGNAKNRELIGHLADKFLLPGTRIENVEALIELRQRSLAGESCLLLSEHYSNFDYPFIYRMMEKAEGLGKEAAASLLPIRGMKLSESSPITALFTRSFDTIIIYPSRSLDTITDPNELAEIRKVSVPINHAAMREMIERKRHGRIITVFPAGTRYRPWDPNSRKGVREIHSYIKTFDNVLFVSINGNILPPQKSSDMAQDQPSEDLMILSCSEVIRGRRYRRDKEASAPEGTDPKQHVVDCVMENLRLIHDQVEPIRLEELKNL